MAGGKVKPLKAPKKQQKGEDDMDDSEIAFREKQKAGNAFRSDPARPFRVLGD